MKLCTYISFDMFRILTNPYETILSQNIYNAKAGSLTDFPCVH